MSLTPQALKHELDGLECVFKYQRANLPNTLPSKIRLLRELNTYALTHSLGILDDDDLLDRTRVALSMYENHFLGFIEVTPLTRYSLLDRSVFLITWMEHYLTESEADQFTEYLNEHLPTEEQLNNFEQFVFDTLSDFLIEVYYGLSHQTELDLTNLS